MATPDFQSLMLPLLQVAGDGREHTNDDIHDLLARSFGVSAEDRKEMLPSGRQSKFENRVGWATTHLRKAGLLEGTGRGRFRITARGADVLRDKPPAIDVRFLNRFPEFVLFRSRTQPKSGPLSQTGDTDRQTPEETLESSYQEIRDALAQELLDRVKRSSARFLETLVVDLLVSMGYGGSRRDAGQAIGSSGDDGIDGIIKEDKLGLDVVYIQAKRWSDTVGRPTVQGFAGSLEGHRAKKGVLITTARFSDEARDYVERIEKKIVLIDGEELAQLMIDHGVGVTEFATYSVKKVDLDYFGEVG